MVQIEGSIHVKRRPTFLLNRAGCQWCLTCVDEAQKLTAAQLQNNLNHSPQQLVSKWSPCATAIPDLLPRGTHRNTESDVMSESQSTAWSNNAGKRSVILCGPHDKAGEMLFSWEKEQSSISSGNFLMLPEAAGGSSWEIMNHNW